MGKLHDILKDERIAKPTNYKLNKKEKNANCILTIFGEFFYYYYKLLRCINENKV